MTQVGFYDFNPLYSLSKEQQMETDSSHSLLGFLFLLLTNLLILKKKIFFTPKYLLKYFVGEKKKQKLSPH